MTKLIRTCLVIALSLFVVATYSPTVLAKKDRSNNSDDDNKDKKDDDQNNKHQKNSNSQQIQQFNQNPQFKTNKSDNSQQVQKIPSNNQPNNQLQIVPQGQGQGQGSQKQLQLQNSSKQPNFQNFQKQNNSQINVQKNVQLQGIQNKPDWISKSHNDHKDVKNFVVKFGGPQPFSNKWYNDHPHAWHYHHDHDDAWKVITAASVVGFLGWEAYHSRPAVVVYEPVGYDTLFVSRPGVIIDPSRGEWMPLGQYSLMMSPADNSTRMLDLATDRFGHIRGSYCDMITGASYNVAGIIDPRTQYAQWSLESNRGLTFYTPMGEMMQPQGAVNVQLPSGDRQVWQLVRMEGGGY